jgi:hypothetical protein
MEGHHPRTIWPNFVSFHPVVLSKKIFKDKQFFNQSEAIVAILDVGKGHQS